MQLCKAQGCEFVQKVEAKDGIAYIGLIDIPKSSDASSNQLFLFTLGKSVTKTDAYKHECNRGIVCGCLVLTW